jgi:hypothetical protein
MDATVFASVPFVQLGNNLLHLPSHNGEISLPVAPNVVAASKRDYIAMPVGAFGAAGRLCSLAEWIPFRRIVALLRFLQSFIPTIELVGLQYLGVSATGL